MAQSEKEQDDYRITYYNAVSSKAVDWLWHVLIYWIKCVQMELESVLWNRQKKIWESYLISWEINGIGS